MSLVSAVEECPLLQIFQLYHWCPLLRGVHCYRSFSYIILRCNDPRKLVMDVAKFSASFCHQSIDHPVCKSLVGTYDGRLFSVENNSLHLRSSRESAL